MRILVTGGSGFIGSALCRDLSSRHDVTGTYHAHVPPALNIPWMRVDLRDPFAMTNMLEKIRPDVVIHGAGLKMGKWLRKNDRRCMEMNGLVSERLGALSARVNPGVFFIFLSSVSVYGMGGKRGPIVEEDPCRPSGINGKSKRYGEKCLRDLYDRDLLRNALILRLAPCYDRDWTRNLERRIMVPGRIAYVRYGSGEQKMSALARQNVSGAVKFILRNRDRFEGFQVYNLCDGRPYTFNEMTGVFRKSGLFAPLPGIAVPSGFLQLLDRVFRRVPAGPLFSLRSQGGKIFQDMTYSPDKLLDRGFRPAHSLETVLLPS